MFAKLNKNSELHDNGMTISLYFSEFKQQLLAFSCFLYTFALSLRITTFHKQIY